MRRTAASAFTQLEYHKGGRGEQESVGTRSFIALARRCAQQIVPSFSKWSA